MSLEQASAGTPVRHSKWGDVERGRTHAKPGRPVKEWHAPAATVVIMAARLGVTPDELREAGRADAAEILEREAARAPAPRPQPPAVTSDAAALDALFEAWVADRARQGAAPSDRVMLEFLWHATDGEGRPKSAAERVRSVIAWADGPGRQAQAALKRA